MDNVVVKVSHGDELRRFTVGADVYTHFSALQERVAGLFAGLRLGAFRLQWTDDEGDLITVTNDAELREALSAANGKTLRLRAVVIDGAAVSAPTTFTPPPSLTTPALTPTLAAAAAADPDVPNVPKLPNTEAGGTQVREQRPEEAIQQMVQNFLTNTLPSTMAMLGPELERLGPQLQAAAAKVGPQLQRAMQQMAGRDVNLEVEVEVEDGADAATAAEPEPTEPVKVFAHRHVICDGCGSGVVGARFKCLQCPDYDLCAGCEATSKHGHHLMLRVRVPSPQAQAFLGNFRRPFARFFAHNIPNYLRPPRRHCEGPVAGVERTGSGHGHHFHCGGRPKSPTAPQAEPVYVPTASIPEPVAAPATESAPEYRAVPLSVPFAQELEDLISMGFQGIEHLRSLLTEHNGRIDLVINELLQ